MPTLDQVEAYLSTHLCLQAKEGVSTVGTIMLPRPACRGQVSSTIKQDSQVRLKAAQSSFVHVT